MDNENLKQLAESLLTYEHGISFEKWKRIEAEYQEMQDEMRSLEKTWKI